MKQYIIRRVLLTIPLLVAISFVCFALISLIPSDPAEVALRVRQIPVISDEMIAETRAELGLDKPYLIRYLTWVWNVLHGDFGFSYVNPLRSVADELLRCLPATLELAGASLVLVILISLPVGFLCAVYKNTLIDKAVRLFVFMTTAMPAYWIGLLLMWLVAIEMNLLPTSGNKGFDSLILPAFTVALTYISTYIRLIRNNMLENMKQDYVKYARVRGIRQRVILVKHILRNSLHTCFVAIGMSIPQLIAGTIVVENVFAWPGLGTLCIKSIFNRDYPVIHIVVSFKKEVQKKIFGTERKTVLHGISLAAQKGESLGILGESGSGKSTTGRVLAGLLKPDSGAVLIEGEDVYAGSKGREHLRNRLSIVFQDYTTSANPRFTIRQVIGEGIAVGARKTGEKLDYAEETARLLRLVGLDESFAKRFPHELSGGQLQRVCIARAIACRSELILFDEAVSSLDAHTQVQIMDLLLDLKEKLGLTYIFITHDLTSITYFCSRVIFLKDGSVVANSPVSELSKLDVPYAKELLGAVLDFNAASA